MNRIAMFFQMFLLLFVFANLGQAQYIIEQIEYRVPINYDIIPENLEFEDQVDEAKYFLDLPESKLKEMSAGMDEESEILKSTIYMEGDNFALESYSEGEGKTTFISDYKKNMFYYVMWPQKKIIEMSSDDMKQMQEKSEAAAEEMLQKLSPELREQVQTGMQSKSAPKTEPVVIPTGKRMKKYGFDCEQYMIEEENKVMVIWASDDVSGLAKKVENISEKMNAVFQTDGDTEKDEWELVPGKLPIEVRSYEMDMMSGPEIEIQAITKIAKSTPPAEKFSLPAESEGFTRGSMKDMMMQIMNNMQEKEK